jgi:hypothetical protein
VDKGIWFPAEDLLKEVTRHAALARQYGAKLYYYVAESSTVQRLQQIIDFGDAGDVARVVFEAPIAP